MKITSNHILAVLIVVVIILISIKGDGWVKHYLSINDSTMYWKNKVQHEQNWIKSTMKKIISLNDSITELESRYIADISYERALRLKSDAEVNKLKKDREKASNNDLVKEFNERVSNKGDTVLIDLTEVGTREVLNTLDELENSNNKNRSKDREISKLEMLRANDKILIDQLQETLRIGKESFEETLNDLQNQAIALQEAKKENMILDAENKKLKRHKLILIGVIVLETMAIIFSAS
jgi:hypothetical protein